MSKIRKSARGEMCTFQIPGVCNFDPDTTVLCHAPHPDKGMGKKGPDTWAAYGCGACHDEMDGRTNNALAVSNIPPALQFGVNLKKQYWLDAIRETQRRLIQKGLMPK